MAETWPPHDSSPMAPSLAKIPDRIQIGKFHPSRTMPLLVLLSFFSVAPFLFAQSDTWDGGGGDDNWGTGNNWVDNSAPSVGTTSDLSFAGSTRLTPNNNYTAWDDFRSIYFNSGAGAFTLNGNSIDLFSGGGGAAQGKIENNSSSTQTVNFTAIGLNGGNVYEMNPVSGALNINSANVYNNHGINVYGSNTLTFGSSSIVANSGGLSVLGGGTVVYQSAHTYTGQTFVNNGTLRFDSGGSANSSTLNILDTSGSSSGTITLNANSLSLSSNINVRSGSSGTATILSQGTGQALSGSVTLNKNAAVNVSSGNGLTISGLLNTNGNTLDKLGAGNLTLSNGSNNAANRYYLGAGTLNVSG